MQNRPLLATPVGGLLEMAQPGRSGWLTRDRSERAIREAIGELAAQPGLVAELIESGGPRAVFEELVDRTPSSSATGDSWSEAPRARGQRPAGRPSSRS